MESTEDKQRKREEYEVQLFGFHSRAVYDSLESMVYERIESTCKKLCESLAKSKKLSKDQLGELYNSENKLKKVYFEAAKPYLYNIKEAVNKYVRLPDNVLRKEDECQKKQYTEEEFNEMEQNLSSLQERAHKAVIMNAALKDELSVLNEFEKNEENLINICNIIENGLVYPDINNRLSEVIDNIKELNSKIANSESPSPEVKYNILENVEHLPKNFSSL